MTTRRSFMAGILAAAAAPAFARSESLMKLWVPPQDIFVPPAGWDLGTGDWTVEFWHQPVFGGQIQRMEVVTANGVQSLYVDGVQAGRRSAAAGTVKSVLDFWGRIDPIGPVYDGGFIHDFRVNRGVGT